MSGSQVQQNKDISTRCHTLGLLTLFCDICSSNKLPREYFSSFVAEAARSLAYIPDAELCLSELSFDKNFSLHLCSRYSVAPSSAYRQMRM